MDSIEHHVEQGKGNVAQAHTELVKAREYQSKARKVLYTDTTTTTYQNKRVTKKHLRTLRG